VQLIRRLYDHFCEKARETKVSCLSIGLSCTAVTTDDGGIGVAFTYAGDAHCCSFNRNYRDYEGEPAIELLEHLKSPMPLHRSIGLALVNALNHREACGFHEDATDGLWMDSLGIGAGTRVATVGLFRPLMKIFKQRGAVLEVLDDFQGVGDKARFYGKLKDWADVLVLTATSILNNSTEEIIGCASSGVKVIMLGPSTPMVADAFGHLPVHILAGTLPIDKEGVLKAVRHGAGTPVIHRFSRKVYLALR